MGRNKATRREVSKEVEKERSREAAVKTRIEKSRRFSRDFKGGKGAKLLGGGQKTRDWWKKGEATSFTLWWKRGREKPSMSKVERGGSPKKEVLMRGKPWEEKACCYSKLAQSGKKRERCGELYTDGGGSGGGEGDSKERKR